MTRMQALHNHLRKWQWREFKLGETDCATFTCDWVDTTCGTDYLRRVRDSVRYTTELGALRAIERAGGYERLVERITGVQARHEGEYEVGDVALFTSAMGRETLGVMGERLVFAPGPEGLAAVDIAHATCFWSLRELCHRP